MTKPELRKYWKKERGAIAPDKRTQWNSKICSHVVAYLTEQKARSVHLFLPIAQHNEVDLTSLLSDGSRTWLTAVSDFATLTMQNVLITENTELSVDQWGIPIPATPHYSDLQPDVILVPLLAVDNAGNRLGYGKGFYDRFLNRYPKAQAIGIGYFPPTDKLPTLPTDVALNGYIYPEGQVLFQQ